MPEYNIIELEAENENLKDTIIEMQKSKIAELEAQLARFINTGIENGHIVSLPKQRPVFRTSSEICKFLEQKSIRKAEHVKKIDNPS